MKRQRTYSVAVGASSFAVLARHDNGDAASACPLMLILATCDNRFTADRIAELLERDDRRNRKRAKEAAMNRAD